MSWDEFDHIETQKCVQGGLLRLRKSDLTAWQRERVQRVARDESVFVLFFYLNWKNFDCKVVCLNILCNFEGRISFLTVLLFNTANISTVCMMNI